MFFAYIKKVIWLLKSVIEIRPKLLELGRKFAKLDVEVYNAGVVVGKAMMMAQLLDRV